MRGLQKLVFLRGVAPRVVGCMRCWGFGFLQLRERLR